MEVAGIVVAVVGVGLAVAFWLRPRPASASSPPWSVGWDKGSRFRLTNTSSKIAQDVRLDLADYPVNLTRDVEPWARIDPGSNVSFLIITVAELDHPSIAVTWRAGRRFRRLRWSTALPSKG